MSTPMSDSLRAILSQVDTTEEHARHVLEETGGDVVEAICILMSLPPKQEKEKTEWDKRREICDSYALEMDKFISKVAKVDQVDGKVVKTIPKPQNISSQ